MAEDTRREREVTRKVRNIVDSTNIASAINVGSKGRRSTVSSRQKVTHKDGVTTTTTEMTRDGITTTQTTREDNDR
ncbi:MAG: hypothetical protein M3161_04635 [Actinomycetota bacterium]|nr:hypothetical protein [Actinomycetota bacterium]